MRRRDDMTFPPEEYERRISELASQQIEASGAQVQLSAGRVVRGQLQGARVLIKAYPPVCSC